MRATSPTKRENIKPFVAIVMNQHRNLYSWGSLIPMTVHSHSQTSQQLRRDSCLNASNFDNGYMFSTETSVSLLEFIASFGYVTSSQLSNDNSNS